MSPAPLGLCIQPACLEHKYIRHRDSSHIFERPERLRAVLLGFAAALARLESIDGSKAATGNGATDDLSNMLSTLSLANSLYSSDYLNVVPPPAPPTTPGNVLMHHPALQLAHSPPMEAPFPYMPKSKGAALPSSTYLRDLFKWASEAAEAIKSTGCEIPDDMGLNPGDLYLGPGSILAIEGAVQTVCQAVDGVCRDETTGPEPEAPSTPSAEPPAPLFSKAFCAIRPPGHHCGEDAPSGFCYVNNVVVGAMHAYIQHDIDRAIIIDFDLHHGNGTQALVMPLNAATYAEDLAQRAGKPPPMERGRKGPRRGWKGFYGSVHDIYSYPCEDGDLDLIRDASVNLAGHGQYIQNIHLQPYASEADFHERIYPLYLALLEKALVFMKETDADPERTVLFISAGFDACEHEHQGMQRHDRRVPVSFYQRYTRDIAAFADKHLNGRVVSVLEGGYGDRALTSAAMGHAIGLLNREGQPDWWSVEQLMLLERAVKKRRKGKLCALPPDLAANPVLARTHAILAQFEGTMPASPAPSNAPSTQATPRMTLRERKPRTMYGDSPPQETRRRPRAVKEESSPSKPKEIAKEEAVKTDNASPSSIGSAASPPAGNGEPRIVLKIPRVPTLAAPSTPVASTPVATAPAESAAPSPIPTHSLRSPMHPRQSEAAAAAGARGVPDILAPTLEAPSFQAFQPAQAQPGPTLPSVASMQASQPNTMRVPSFSPTSVHSPPAPAQPASFTLSFPCSFRPSVLTTPDLPPTPGRPAGYEPAVRPASIPSGPSFNTLPSLTSMMIGDPSLRMPKEQEHDNAHRVVAPGQPTNVPKVSVENGQWHMYTACSAAVVSSAQMGFGLCVCVLVTLSSF